MQDKNVIKLTDQDAALLEQGASMLEGLENDERNRGNCSTAEGAGCCAHAVRRLASALLAHEREIGQCLHQIQEPAPVQAAPAAVAEYGSREERMVVLQRGHNGIPTVWCDPEIADIVGALNSGGVKTVASCSGHGEKPGGIALADGRQLLLLNSLDAFNSAISTLCPSASAPAAVAVPDGGTPGPWRVRKRVKDGQVLGCFVTAPDCQGRAYDADILGDDYDTMERKLADCELIVAAVNANRAALASTPAAAPVVLPEPAGMKLVSVELLHRVLDSETVTEMSDASDELRALLATATGLPAQAVLDYPWRDRLLDGQELVRDQQGFAEHPELPLLDEGMKPRAFFAALGVDMKHTMPDDDLSMDEYDAMSDAENWSAWMPRPPIGDAWNLVAIFDTEDGPVAWWARAQKESREAASQAQADARDAVWLQPADMAALERFAETTDDDQSYDIGKDSVQRLSSFGCLNNCGFGRYEITSFGSYLLNDWERARILPFTTQADRDAAHRAAIAAAKGE